MNTGKFKCHINLGNAGMQSKDDVATALEGVLMSIDKLFMSGGRIKDINGNTVGFWELDIEDEEYE